MIKSPWEGSSRLLVGQGDIRYKRQARQNGILAGAQRLSDCESHGLAQRRERIPKYPPDERYEMAVRTSQKDNLDHEDVLSVVDAVEHVLKGFLEVSHRIRVDAVRHGRGVAGSRTLITCQGRHRRIDELQNRGVIVRRTA